MCHSVLLEYHYGWVLKGSHCFYTRHKYIVWFYFHSHHERCKSCCQIPSDPPFICVQLQAFYHTVCLCCYEKRDLQAWQMWKTYLTVQHIYCGVIGLWPAAVDDQLNHTIFMCSSGVSTLNLTHVWILLILAEQRWPNSLLGFFIGFFWGGVGEGQRFKWGKSITNEPCL